MHEKVYIEGYDAYYDGIKENPYDKDSHEWFSWEDGWTDASLDDD